MRRLFPASLLILLAAGPVMSQTATRPPPVVFIPVPPAARDTNPDGPPIEIVPNGQCQRTIGGGFRCFSWAKRPNLIDARQVYPAAALAAGRSGVATLRCAVTDEGFLADCRVSSETPAGEGFGEAAMQLAAKFEVNRSAEDWRIMTGPVVVTPVWFDLGPGSIEQVRQFGGLRLTREADLYRLLDGSDCGMKPLSANGGGTMRLFCGEISLD